MPSAIAILPLESQRRRGRTYVALAALAWSSAGILQRELDVAVPLQLAGRGFFAVLGLLAYIAVVERGRIVHAFRAIGGAGLAIAALLAVSSGSFFVALNHASVASVLFMQALAPVLAAVLGLVVGEVVTRRTWVAMAVALAGVTLMVGGPGRPSGAGIALSFLMSLSFAAVLVITRHKREVSMAPATCLSQALVLAGAGIFVRGGAVSARDLGLLASLGVGQIGLGLALLAVGGRLIPAAEVALITLLEVVLGPLWVWIFLSEQPGVATLVGGLVVLGAVAIQVGRGEDAVAPPP